MSSSKPIRFFTLSEAEGALSMVAVVSISTHWIGVEKRIERKYLDRMAASLNAEADTIKARKRLINTKNPSYAELDRLRYTVKYYCNSVTYPYVEDGMRIISSGIIDEFNENMKKFEDNLKVIVSAFKANYKEIKEEAKEMLGELYNELDYPAEDEIDNCFGFKWRFLEVRPPEFLRVISPEIYEEERKKMAKDIMSSIIAIESKILESISGKLNEIKELLDNPDPRKRIRKSSVESLYSILDKIEKAPLYNRKMFTDLVNEIKSSIDMTNFDKARADAEARKLVSDVVSGISARVESLLETAPRRAIIRG
ncbi:MAG: hypothetical protein QXT45_05815 [Candidatus Bilamarchaeaceae archaeon]